MRLPVFTLSPILRPSGVGYVLKGVDRRNA